MTSSRLNKMDARYERDPTQEELKKSINDTLSFEGDNSISNALDFLLNFRGEERKIRKKLQGLIYSFSSQRKWF